MNSEKKETLKSVIIYSIFTMIAVVMFVIRLLSGVGFSEAFAVFYWIFIIPTIPGIIAFMLGCRPKNKTIIIFDMNAYRDVQATRLIIFILIGLFLSVFVGFPITLYRYIKAVIELLKK